MYTVADYNINRLDLLCNSYIYCTFAIDIKNKIHVY